MIRSVAWCARVVVAVALLLCHAPVVLAQGRTDVITLANGDHITGEVVALERGQLEFKTDDAGTLYLEWDKLVSLLAPNRVVEVVTADGLRFVGTLGPAPNRSIVVLTGDGPVTLTMAETTIITPIGRSFWRQLDGSIDSGFNYTRSSGVAQLNLNWETLYRRPAFRGRIAASLTLTEKEDGEDDDRGSLEISYLRYPWQHWFITGAGRFETNESLGLEFRSQAAVAAGPRLVNTN